MNGWHHILAGAHKKMVQQSRQGTGGGDIAYNFTFGTKIERIYVSATVRSQLAAGQLVIIRLGGIPPRKGTVLKVEFSNSNIQEVLHEDLTFYRQPNHRHS